MSAVCKGLGKQKYPQNLAYLDLQPINCILPIWGENHAVALTTTPPNTYSGKEAGGS